MPTDGKSTQIGYMKGTKQDKLINMKRLKPLLLCCSFFYYSNILIAQETTRCNSTLDYSYVQANDPSMYQHFLEIDNFIAQYVSSGGSNTRLINPNGTIIIPVVVHVLHSGEAVGTGLNISDAVIQSQIDVLNEDFRRLNSDRVNTPADFVGRAADFNIEFRLACIDPNGNFTTGIERKQTSRSIFWAPTSVRQDGSGIEGSYSAKRLPDGLPAWPANKYLNIWVCNLGSLLGYAVYPQYVVAHPEEDGVVIRTSAFGRIGGAYGGGRTGTHEVGHWLDILHLNYDNRFPCTDDFVSDTPKEMTIDKTCRTYPFLTNRCDVSDPSTMFMNFMEYVPDDCMNLFTLGQRQRARAMFARIGNLSGPRADMLDNIFAIQQPSTTINCATKIKLFNPCCLTPTWSVVSGPASINTGQNTNEVTLQISGNGTVTLRATAENYVSDINISVTTNLNLTISGSASVCNNRPSYYTINLPSGGSVVWSSFPSGKVNLSPAGPNGVVATPMNLPTGSYTLTGTVNGSCTSTPAQLLVNFISAAPPYNCLQIGNGNCLQYIYKCTEQYYGVTTLDIPNHPSDVAYWHWTVNGGHFSGGATSLIVPYVPIYVVPDQGSVACTVTISPMNECMVESTNEPFRYVWVNTGQHCSGYYYIMSPNPAMNEVIISTTDNSSETNIDRSITAINIYSQEGNLKKQKRFGKVKTASIPVSDLTNGMYVVEIISGDYKEQKQLIVQH